MWTLFVVYIIISHIFAGVTGLHCYRCLKTECDGTSEECEGVREVVIRELRNFYHVPVILDPCPVVEDGTSWVFMQAGEEACLGGACAAGRLQIKSYESAEDTKKPKLVSHATVLGCAKTPLISSIIASRKMSVCNEININGSSVNTIRMFHKLNIEHCGTPDMLCSDGDFCVKKENSVVKPFVNNEEAAAKFDYGLTIGIIVFIVIVFMAIIAARTFSFPLNRPSNLPKSFENGELVNVVRSDSRREENQENIERVQDT